MQTGSREAREFAAGEAGVVAEEPPAGSRGRAEAEVLSPQKTEELGKFATLLSIL